MHHKDDRSAPHSHRAELAPTGFVAGTLVHTKQGLRPIGQIRAGDYVLSRPESGVGEVTYKRVIRTVARDDCETWFVSWFDVNLHEEAYAKRITQQDYLDAHGNSFVITTPSHPFWVVESEEEDPNKSGLYYAEDRILHAWKGRPWPRGEWVRADHLADGMRLMLQDGRIIELYKSIPAYRSAEPDQIWTPQAVWPSRENGLPGTTGILIDLKNQSVSPEVPLEGIRVMRESEFWKHVRLNPNKDCYDDDPIGNAPQSWYRAQVYNLEVEDYHSYFVDKLGVWVHHANGETADFERIDKPPR